MASTSSRGDDVFEVNTFYLVLSPLEHKIGVQMNRFKSVSLKSLLLIATLLFIGLIVFQFVLPSTTRAASNSAISSVAAGNGSKPTSQTVEMKVIDTGFEPKQIQVKPGIPVVLNITRTSDLTCSTEILVPSRKINQKLPLNKMVSVQLGSLEKGEIKFGCGMNMMDHGIIDVK